jgi:hypothetical protein
VAFFLTPIYLAACRSIEKDPDREIIAEVFKAMFDGREQDVVGAKVWRAPAQTKSPLPCATT